MTNKTDARILFWDLENTGLQADFGTTLSTGYKWLGEKKVYVPCISDYAGFAKDPTDDKQLIKDFLKVYSSADINVTYYGSGYDRPWLLAKCLEHGLPIPPNVPMVDLYYTVRANMKISRKSLQNVGYYLGLSNEKTPVEGKVWRRAQAGNIAAIKYVKDHCRADVLLLEEAYLKLRPLVRQHPYIGARGPCRVCGGTNLQARGRAATVNTGERTRLHCQDCGSWSTTPDPKPKQVVRGR